MVISGTVTALKELYIFVFCDNYLTVKFPKMYLPLFWISVENKYKNISNEFMITWIHFVLPYLCDWIICSPCYGERIMINGNVE